MKFVARGLAVVVLASLGVESVIAQSPSATTKAELLDRASNVGSLIDLLSPFEVVGEWETRHEFGEVSENGLEGRFRLQVDVDKELFVYVAEVSTASGMRKATAGEARLVVQEFSGTNLSSLERTGVAISPGLKMSAAVVQSHMFRIDLLGWNRFPVRWSANGKLRDLQLLLAKDQTVVRAIEDDDTIIFTVRENFDKDDRFNSYRYEFQLPDGLPVHTRCSRAHTGKAFPYYESNCLWEIHRTGALVPVYLAATTAKFRVVDPQSKRAERGEAASDVNLTWRSVKDPELKVAVGVCKKGAVSAMQFLDAGFAE